MTTYSPSPAQASFILSLVYERADLYTKLGQESSATAIREYVKTFDMREITDVQTTLFKMKATNKALKEQANAKMKETVTGILNDAPAVAADGAGVAVGLYHLDGKNYRVKESKRGRFYAEEVVTYTVTDYDGTNSQIKTRFDYAAGMVYKLTADHKMTKEQAQAHGAYAGSCVACGRTLTKADSVDRMMGPRCHKKYFG